MIGGTNVGSGASLIVTVREVACPGAGAGIVTGFASVLLIKAQPPSVAANEAAVISILTPGALEAGFLVGLLAVMIMTLLELLLVKADSPSCIHTGHFAH